MKSPSEWQAAIKNDYVRNMDTNWGTTTGEYAADRIADVLLAMSPWFDDDDIGRIFDAARVHFEEEVSGFTRYAEVVVSAGANPAKLAERVAAYLPPNYRVEWDNADGGPTVTITGRDVAGWTLDGYVIPRLASGLIFAREVK